MKACARRAQRKGMNMGATLNTYSHRSGELSTLVTPLCPPRYRKMEAEVQAAFIHPVLLGSNRGSGSRRAMGKNLRWRRGELPAADRQRRLHRRGMTQYVGEGFWVLKVDASGNVT